MAVTSNLIVLVLLSCSYRFIIASPLEYNNRVRFNCPERSSCSCSYVVSDYEIECPPIEPLVLVKVQPATYVQIECMTMDEKVYRHLPVMNMGDIPMVQFRRCPLPGSGSSIQTILDRLGLKRIRSFIFLSYGADLGSTLVRQHLQGFNELERLIISGNGLSELPEDLFNDVGNLTWLDLRSNKVHLPVNIFKNLKKLEYLELGYNNLKTLEPGVFHNQNKLKYLNLWGNDLQHLSREAFEGVSSILELDLSSNNIETLQPDVFSLLKNLTNLNLNANNFASMPEGLFQTNKNLSRLRLMDNRVKLETLPSGFLSNLQQLEDVHIKCGLKNVPGDMFNGTENIKNLSMASNELTTLPVGLFNNFTSILDLDLSNNQLNVLEDGLFESAQSLLVLKLSHNNLSYISETIFHGLRSIQKLFLDYNNLQSIHPTAFSTNNYLSNIQLENNNLSFVSFDEGIMQYDMEMGSPFQPLRELRILNLRNNSIMNILEDWNYVLINLEQLDLSYNKISLLSLSNLQFLSKDITVNLSHNAIQEIDFRDIDLQTEFQNEMSPKKTQVYLENNPLRCDCLLLHFVQFLRKEIGKADETLRILPGEMKCNEPESMANKYVAQVQPKELLCLLDSPNSSSPKCPQNCTCFVRTADKGLIVNCSNGNLQTVPDLPNPIKLGLRFTELFIENNSLVELPQVNFTTPIGYNFVSEIHANNNEINDLQPENLPRNLKVLNMINNKMQRINKSVLEILNATKELEQISLTQNPWFCDCDAREFLIFTQQHYKKIQDIGGIRCHDGSQFNKNGISDLCPEDKTVIIAISITMTLFGLLIGIAAALYYKYQQEIKVWLFAHNLCSWFVTEFEVDKHKKYDAFVSYSHKDVDFITEQIVPELENGPHPFKLCLHDRDWIVGCGITQSIAESVEDSRRTIVVLSQNFLESIWGKMEFQVAHKNALTEGRARVIILIYGDIGDIDHLDAELKAYLKSNTYIKWGDPWFWKKLRYAMPHPNAYKEKGLIKNNINSSVDDKLELIKPIPVTPPLTTPPAELAGQKFHNGLNGLNGLNGSLNGHVNGAFIINTNAKQSDV